MPTTYPGTTQTITDYAGTVTLANADHASWHATTSDTVEAIESVLGTTAGTSVLKNFNAGDFPARMNSSSVLQQSLSGTLGTLSSNLGTLNNMVMGSPSVTGGTLNNVVLGTPTVLGTLQLKDTGLISQTGTADHINIVAGASKVVKSSMVRSNNGTTLYQTGAVTQSGWGFILGNNTANSGTYVTYPIPFTNKPVIVPTLLGYKDGSDPTDIDDFAQWGAVFPNMGTTAIGSAQVWVNATSGTIINTRRVGFSWIAVGSI